MPWLMGWCRGLAPPALIYSSDRLSEAVAVVFGAMTDAPLGVAVASTNQLGNISVDGRTAAFVDGTYRVAESLFHNVLPCLLAWKGCRTSWLGIDYFNIA